MSNKYEACTHRNFWRHFTGAFLQCWTLSVKAVTRL